MVPPLNNETDSTYSYVPGSVPYLLPPTCYCRFTLPLHIVLSLASRLPTCCRRSTLPLHNVPSLTLHPEPVTADSLGLCIES